jgi:hypothetical protein
VHYFKDNPPAVPPIPLTVGDRARFAGDHRWWTVKAVTANFAALTRQAEFQPRGLLCYTVVDWRNGVRGACDLIGQGWGNGTYTETECAKMLASFEMTDEEFLTPGAPLRLRVSQRNWVPIAFTDVPEPTPAAPAPELPELEGFEEIYGVQVGTIGEDCGMIALGHHADRRALAAFNALARRLGGRRIGSDSCLADWANITFMRTAGNRLERTYAVETDGEDCCAGDEHVWHVLKAVPDEPGAFPVMLWNW